jgi:hypothetical protein
MSPFAVAALLPVAVFIFVCGSPIVPSTVFVFPTPVAVVTVSGFFVTTRFDKSGGPLSSPGSS